jgi:predicted acylesterase/phospholipase RssA
MTNKKAVLKRRRRAGALRAGPQRLPIASCFGSGGSYGIGFILGAVTGLADAGIDVMDGPMLGTSAGAYAAAALQSKVSFNAVMEAWPKEFKWRVARAVDVTRSVYGHQRAEGAGAVAVRLARWRRAVLWGDRYDLADIVAASSSPPPFAWPHKLDGRRYIDGGYGSPASIDFAPLADLLVLVTPLWDGTGRIGRRAARRGRREMRAYALAGGGQVLHIVPNDEINELRGYKVPAIFDAELAKRIYPMAQELGRRIGGEFRAAQPA